MRIFPIASAILLAGLTSAHATTSFSCDGEDASAKFQISGAYGTSIGSGLANFGGDLHILLADAPKDIRKIKLTRKLVVQQWYIGRDMKFLLRFEKQKPYRDVVLIVDTRRAEDDETAPYEGTYTLSIEMPPVPPATDTKRIEASGKASCGAG